MSPPALLPPRAPARLLAAPQAGPRPRLTPSAGRSAASAHGRRPRRVPQGPLPEREETPRARALQGTARGPEPAPCTAQRARPRAPRLPESPASRGRSAFPGSTAARRPGPQLPPCPRPAVWPAAWHPEGLSDPRLGHAALCAWRVLPPGRLCRSAAALPAASREAAAAPRAPAPRSPPFRRGLRLPHAALRLR